MAFRKFINLPIISFLMLAAPTLAYATPGKCSELFNAKSLQLEPLLKKRGYRYIEHATSKHVLKDIISSGALLSSQSQADRKTGKVVKSYDGSAPNMVFTTLIHKNYDHKWDSPTHFYGSDEAEIKIRLPLSIIDIPQFSHFSISWFYGMRMHGGSFSKESPEITTIFDDPSLHNGNEVVFLDSVPMDLSKVIIHVPAKSKNEIVLMLKEIEPKIDWENKVISPKDYWPDVRMMGLNDWRNLEVGVEAALKDLNEKDPNAAFKTSLFLLENIESTKAVALRAKDLSKIVFRMNPDEGFKVLQSFLKKDDPRWKGIAIASVEVMFEMILKKQDTNLRDKLFSFLRGQSVEVKQLYEKILFGPLVRKEYRTIDIQYFRSLFSLQGG